MKSNRVNPWKRKAKIFTMLTAMLICVLLQGCGNNIEKVNGSSIARDVNHGSNSRKVILLLTDVSQSTVARRAQYLADLKIVVNGMQEGDELIAGTISAHSATEYPIRAQIPESSMFSGDNQLYHSSRVTKIKAEIIAEAQKMLMANTKVRGTDILSALDGAGRMFSGSDTAGFRDKQLIIMSDMVQQSNYVDFYGEDLTPSVIEDIITHQKNQGEFPDLHGVQVWIDGDDAGQELTQRQDARVERFWETYFQQAGASLPRSRYLGSLANYGPSEIYDK